MCGFRLSAGRLWLSSQCLETCQCVLQICSPSSALTAAVTAQPQPRALVLDNVRIIDGTGAAPIENGRIVLQGERIAAVGPAAKVAAPANAERVDLAGKTVIPGLIDLHFHIESDPRLALRQLAHGITAFRDPGQWNEKFVELRRMVAADGLPGPRIFTTGPHIDGENPAYPADSVVARDAEEARRHAETNVAQGASALKIYFRLPIGSARAVIDVCNAHRIPCTAHLEVLDAGELIAAGLHGVEHITSFGVGLVPRLQAETYRQAVLRNNDARRDGRYRLFSAIDLDGPEAKALYAVVKQRRPWVDADARRVRAARGQAGRRHERRTGGGAGGRIPQDAAADAPPVARGRSHCHGRPHRSPLRRPRRSAVARARAAGRQRLHAARGDHCGHDTAAGFLFRDKELGALRAGLQADLVVLGGNARGQTFPRSGKSSG